MDRALELARESLLITYPNPRVGCVLADPDGRVIGAGRTQQAGGAHAEVMALKDAQENGFATLGATAYVTLEPCSHQGRTGPCCDALVAAGIARVVASIADPNPLVGGRGFERLRAAGISVEVGCGAEESRELNIGFFSRMIRKKPWVRLKAAISLDGFTAMPSGESQWITSEAARSDGHLWRARSCAVLTGVGTVLADNPKLNVRNIDTPRQPMAVVCDSQLRTPPEAALFDCDRRVLIYTASSDSRLAQRLKSRGAEVRRVDSTMRGRMDLRMVLEDLAQEGVNELHVEAGAILNGSLLASGLVDELLMYVAPTLLGGGVGVARMPPLGRLSEAPRFDYVSALPVGGDVRLIARSHGANDF